MAVRLAGNRDLRPGSTNPKQRDDERDKLKRGPDKEGEQQAAAQAQAPAPAPGALRRSARNIHNSLKILASIINLPLVDQCKCNARSAQWPGPGPGAGLEARDCPGLGQEKGLAISITISCFGGLRRPPGGSPNRGA